jgi:MFS family permease
MLESSSPPSSPEPSVLVPACVQHPLIDAFFLRVLAVQVAVGFGFSTYFLLPKYLATELSAGPSTIGAVTAVGLCAVVLAAPVVGWALDRFGRRTPALLGAFLVFASSLAMTTVHEIGAWLYFIRVVQGLGFALGFNAASASVADRAPAERLGQAIGLLGVASLATNAVAPALGETLAHAYGWDSVFVMAAATGLVTLALSPALPGRPSLTKAQNEAVDRALDPRLLAVALVNGAIFGTLITFTQSFALERGAERVAGYFLGYTLGALVVRLALGGAADRFGRRRVAVGALFGYGLVALATADLNLRWLALLGVGFGVTHGFLYPAVAALVVEESIPGRRGRDLTYFNAAFNLGAGAALFGCGWLARAVGYPPVFILMGSITLISAVLFALSKRRPA